LPRAFYLTLGTEKTLGKQASLPRTKQKALGTEKNTRQRFLYQEPIGWLSAKNFFAKCNFLTLGKENLKNHFFASNFFYHQHTLIQNLCSNLAQFQLYLLYLKILILSRYFFVYVRYELQVHDIIE
jgi:hypothetical protein